MIHILALLAPAHAASVTVSPGDDLNALTSSLIAGDVVTFRAGVYELDTTLTWSGLGTEVQPIQFLVQSGAEAILRNNGGGFVARVTGSDWITITGLIFEGGGDVEVSQPHGLRIDNSTNVLLEDCVIRNVYGTGLRIDGDTDGLTIRHNEVGPTVDGGGIVVGVSDGAAWMQDSVITNNLVHDIGGAGLQFLPATQGVTIEHNVVFRVGGDGLVLPSTNLGDQNIAKANVIWQVGDDGIDIYGSALVQNNLVFEAGDDGIVTRDAYGSLFDLQVSHNTIARTGGWAAELNDWYLARAMVFANNALVNPTGYGLSYADQLSNQDPYEPTVVDDTDNFIANNVVTGLVSGIDVAVRPSWLIEGGGVADFEDMDTFDYYPSVGSTLRDAGSPDGNAYIPIDDFNGVLRDGGSPTAGAYEYDGQGNPGWPIQEAFKDVENLGNRSGGQLTTGCCGGGNGKGGGQALVFGPLLLLGVLSRRRRDA